MKRFILFAGLVFVLRLSFNAEAQYSMGESGDSSLPVELSSFTAMGGDGQATLRWVTESEADNLGFHVYRAPSENGEYERLTAEILAGTGTGTGRREYAFTDLGLTNGGTYWYKIEDVAFNGMSTLHGPISVTLKGKSFPAEFGLLQNTPNPFNPITEIRYQLPTDSHVKLAIHDALGQKVQVLVNHFVNAGYRSVVWDAKETASGLYFIRMEVGDFVEVRKMMLVR